MKSESKWEAWEADAIARIMSFHNPPKFPSHQLCYMCGEGKKIEKSGYCSFCHKRYPEALKIADEALFSRLVK